MQLLIAAALTFGLTASASSRADAVRADEISLQSLTQTSKGPVKTLKGNVRIETSGVIIQADEAVFNANTLDIQPTGNVHITLKK